MRLVKLVMILAAVSVASGCVMLALGAAAGGTGALYVKGKATKSYSASLDRTYDAVVAALEGADVVITKRQLGGTVGKIHGTAADGESVKVDLKSVGDNVTEVRLRVGLLGNRERAENLIARIDARLL